ncbi:MAG: hypothetical protein M3167_06805 [Acidobacteriota bacterium]|nr:hypothetical protein [Acidobacteriota bacterium]
MNAGDAAPSDPVRDLLRHTLATLAYRGGKVLRGAPPEFSAFRAAEGTRTPGEILAHIGDLLDWAVSLAAGAHVYREVPPGAWDRDVERFFACLKRFDGVLASPDPLGFPPGKLFQGPIADALTHVGQIGMMRRMAGASVRGENYFKADIAAGRVGAEQSAPRFEFD